MIFGTIGVSMQIDIILVWLCVIYLFRSRKEGEKNPRKPYSQATTQGLNHKSKIDVEPKITRWKDPEVSFLPVTFFVQNV